MPMTPETGGQPYCSPATFLLAYDARQVGQLVRDDLTQATPAELLADPVLAWALAAASGDVETATLAGRRYGIDDLAALDGNGAARLAQLVADLAFGRIARRRGLPGELPPQVLEAEQALDALRSGGRILPFREAADAGAADTAPITAADRASLNLLSDALRRSMGTRLGERGPGRPWR